LFILHLVFMSQLVINTSFNIELGFELAPIHKRIIASLLDLFIMVVYVFTVFEILHTSFSKLIENDNKYSAFLYFLLFCPILFYHLLSEIIWNGQSIGKRLLGLRVISIDGNNPSLSQYALRWFLRPIDFAFTSYIGGLICVAVTKNGQRIGDLAAGTTLVSNKLPYRIDQTIFKNITSETYTVTYPQVMRLSDRDLNTINNVLQQHSKNNMAQYVASIANKVKAVLDIESDEDATIFLEILLRDYNFLSQK
jgi:uncharacterized RDD family membrane protein YckC